MSDRPEIESPGSSLHKGPDSADFAQFAENIPTLAWMAGPDGYIDWYNRRWYEYTGTTPAEMAGWGWQSVHDPEVLPQVMERWQASIAAGTDFEMTFPLRGADGTFRPFLTRITCLKDGEGRVLRWFGTNADISSQKDVEGALQRSELQLRQAVVAGGGIGTWFWDIKADRMIADDTFANIYGVDPEEARSGVPVAQFFAGISPDDQERVDASINQALRDGGTFNEEYRLIVGGKTRWVVATGQVMLDDAGEPEHFPGMGFDVTERKLGEIRQAALLELSDRLRDLDDPDEISFVASEILGRALGVTRAGYGLINEQDETIRIARDWHMPGMASIAGTLSFRAYGSYVEDLKLGRTVAIADVRDDPRTASTAAALEAISTRSFVAMPLVEQGAFVALLFITHDQPRVWREDDQLLIRDIVERVRAATERLISEQARQASEEQFRVFAQAVPNHIWAARPDGNVYW
ncbi:MAG: PAS domain-containing protein, partial [Sphingomicrobium sp.]